MGEFVLRDDPGDATGRALGRRPRQDALERRWAAEPIGHRPERLGRQFGVIPNRERGE
jgi:hypothetical protein